MADVSFRFATVDNVDTILNLIKQLAAYEKAADQMVATANLLRQTLFEKRFAEVLLAKADSNKVGFALSIM